MQLNMYECKLAVVEIYAYITKYLYKIDKLEQEKEIKWFFILNIK